MSLKNTVARRARLTVEMPCSIDRRLEALSEQTGLSKTELIREAVRLLAEMAELRSEGFVVGGTKLHEDGSRETVRLPITY